MKATYGTKKFKIAEVSEHFIKGLTYNKDFYEHIIVAETFFLVMSLYSNSDVKTPVFEVTKADVRRVSKSIYTLRVFALPVNKIKMIAERVFEIDDYSLNLYTCKDLGNSLEIEITPYFLKKLKKIHLKEIGMFPVTTNNRLMDICLYKQYTCMSIDLSLKALCDLMDIKYVVGNWQTKYDRLMRALRHAETKFMHMPVLSLEEFKRLYFSGELLNWGLQRLTYK